MLPSVLGTIAMFEVIVPSMAFSVDASGGSPGSGHKLR